MTENDLRITILRSEEYAYYTDSLVVDDVTVQDGIPIVLSWPLHTSVDPFKNIDEQTAVKIKTIINIFICETYSEYALIFFMIVVFL